MACPYKHDSNEFYDGALNRAYRVKDFYFKIIEHSTDRVIDTIYDKFHSWYNRIVWTERDEIVKCYTEPKEPGAPSEIIFQSSGWKFCKYETHFALAKPPLVKVRNINTSKCNVFMIRVDIVRFQMNDKYVFINDTVYTLVGEPIITIENSFKRLIGNYLIVKEKNFLTRHDLVSGDEHTMDLNEYLPPMAQVFVNLDNRTLMLVCVIDAKLYAYAFDVVKLKVLYKTPEMAYVSKHTIRIKTDIFHAPFPKF